MTWQFPAMTHKYAYSIQHINTQLMHTTLKKQRIIKTF